MHKSAIAMDNPLNAGDKVEFNVVTSRKGQKAENVTKKLGTRADPRKQFLEKVVSGKVRF